MVRRASRGDKLHLSGPQIEHQKIMNLTQIWDPKLDTKNHGFHPRWDPNWTQQNHEFDPTLLILNTVF